MPLITASSLRVTFSCKCLLQTKKTKSCVPTSTTPTCCAGPYIVSCRQVDMRWCIIDLHPSVSCDVSSSRFCTLSSTLRYVHCACNEGKNVVSLAPWVIWFMASLSDHCQLWSTFPLRSIFSQPSNSFITASK